MLHDTVGIIAGLKRSLFTAFHDISTKCLTFVTQLF